MTSDTPPIPAPPPGWAIVPADDARLDCLPAKPMFFHELWNESAYSRDDAIPSENRKIYTYALPIEPTLPQPWSLPAPPAGQAWHRQDWEEAMLPEGYRPLLLGEARQDEDEWSYEPQETDMWKRVEYFGPDALIMIEGQCSHHRTRRPLPASQPDANANALFTDPITWECQGTIDGKTYQVKGSVGSQPEQASPEEEVIPAPTMAPPKMLWFSEIGLLPGKQKFTPFNQPTTDPKGEAGKAKPPLALLPPEALRQAALAHGSGTAKYGAFNWRENQVNATTYISAMMRHIGQYLDGEDADAESGLSHLAHVIASANILIDAKHCGTLVDDRPKRP